jgi:hypothetical protein
VFSSINCGFIDWFFLLRKNGINIKSQYFQMCGNSVSTDFQ